MVTFFYKWQIEFVLDVAGHMVSVQAIQVCTEAKGRYRLYVKHMAVTVFQENLIYS